MSSASHTAASRSQVRYTNVAQQPSTPFSSPPPQPIPSAEQSSPSWWSRIGVDHWEWELAAAILCVSALAAIVGVLVSYDQHPVPDLPSRLTINAIIAFISTLAKSSLTLILAAALRQEKWLWFIDRPRPLNTIDSFEEASRGPYGSLLLLLKLHGSFRALLAASILILSLGFEPFLQQLVTFSTHDVPIDGATASIRTPTAYDEPVIGSLGGSSLSLNAQIGAFGGANGTIPTPECTSGNCTWPEYNTLALCTICQDMTSEIQVSNPFELDLDSLLDDFERGNQSSFYREWNPTFAFPKGNGLTADISLTMENSSGSFIMTQWGINYPRRRAWPLNISPELDSAWDQTWRNETYAGHPSPLFAMGYLDLNLTEDFSALRIQRATECAFSPCVHTVSTQVLNGIVNSNITDTEYGAVILDAKELDGSSISGGWRARVNGTDFEIIDRGGVNNVQGHAYLLIQALRITLEGNTTYNMQGVHYPDAEDQSSAYDGTGFSQARGPWSSAGQQAIDGAGNFSLVVNDVGHALTGRFQQLAATSVSGTATRSYVIIEVRWMWLIYPLSLLVLSIMSLIATILATHIRHMVVWKESSLPLLYRYAGTTPIASAGAGQRMGRHVKALSNHVSQIIDEAREELVCLRRHQTLWTLDRETLQDGDKGRNGGKNALKKNSDGGHLEGNSHQRVQRLEHEAQPTIGVAR